MSRPPCEDPDKRWYYDPRNNECAEFVYEGCLNEGNRFPDKEACERTCKAPPAVTEGTSIILWFDLVKIFTDQSFHKTLKWILLDWLICICIVAPHDLTLCYQLVEPGNCNESIPSYFFDPTQQRCMSFMYTGCGGNANRYNTEEQCERQCGRFREQGFLNNFQSASSNLKKFLFLTDVCSLPKETGPCRGFFRKVYYDSAIRRCLPFTYGGCGGNANRFSSIEECEGICIKHEETKPNTTSSGNI